MSEASTRTALITGANKGIGFEVARQIGRTGVTVLVGARNPVAGEEAVAKLIAEGIHAKFVALDLNDRASIQAAAKRIESEFGHLDILVNNAGVFLKDDGPPSTGSLEAMEATFQTNFFGAVAVTQALLPLVRKSVSGRIVNVSSGLGSLALNSDPESPYADTKYLGYNASKAALNMFTIQLAHELRDTAIKVNAADPGYTATDLNNNSGHQTIEEGAAETVRLSLLDDSGPSGSYSATEGVVAW